MRNLNFHLIVLLSGLVLLVWGCQQSTMNSREWTENPDYQKLTDDPEIYRDVVKGLTDIIVYDIFSPPVASRIYGYASIAGYEVMVKTNPEYLTLAGQLTDMPNVPDPPQEVEICYPLASSVAFLTSGRAMIFSEDQMDSLELKTLKRFQAYGVPAKVYYASIDYGKKVGEHILIWADKDNYKQTRTFPQYTVTSETGRWTPTPPDYMAGIEPHWNKIRPFIIDSATQFIPIPPTPFNMNKSSQFFKEVMEVYETGVNLDEEQKEIAEFWDCNPFVTTHVGHVMYATKKITPGGHWIGITDITTRKAKCDFMQTAEAYARVSIALADAFISCWDEKYRSNLIRPETVINEHIDEEWVPLLQTPPFPEYTSGHSVISTAAAITLTDLFGEPFPFVDSTEVEYGLTARNFNSFLDASAEAAISRLYGGIHYMPAISKGVEQGRKVGNYVVENLKTRQIDLQMSNSN